jgi:hypothetical protein
MGGKTKRNPPTACRGLNKTNCIFPCQSAKHKLNLQHKFCRSKFKRMIKDATKKNDKKLVKMLKNKEKNVTMKMKRAEKNMEQVNKDVISAVKETEETKPSFISSITNFFTPKPKEAETDTEPKSEEAVAVTENETEKTEEEEEGSESKEVIEPVVEEETKDKDDVEKENK